MFLIRLLMRLCFSWQYVLVISYGGTIHIERATYFKCGWYVVMYGSKIKHQLYPQGRIDSEGYCAEWLPLTPPMRAVYHKIPPRSKKAK